MGVRQVRNLRIKEGLGGGVGGSNLVGGKYNGGFSEEGIAF